MNEKLLCTVHAVIYPTSVITAIVGCDLVNVQHGWPRGEVHARSAVQFANYLVTRIIDRIDRVTLVA